MDAEFKIFDSLGRYFVCLGLTLQLMRIPGFIKNTSRMEGPASGEPQRSPYQTYAVFIA
jgi:hypothetical protein